MTALATIFALIPMALGLTGGGGFISRPLAVVVIGGLVSSTALTLILVPVLYHLVEGAKERCRAAPHGAALPAHGAHRDPGGQGHRADPPADRCHGAAGQTPPAANGSARSPPVVPQAYGPGTLINPATGMIPLTRKERKEVEERAQERPKGFLSPTLPVEALFRGDGVSRLPAGSLWPL